MNIFFIDEHNSSKFNGIGTFRDVLIPLLAKYEEIQLTMISLNSDNDDLEMKAFSWGTDISMPFVDEGRWRENGECIWGLLAHYIPDSPENIFIFNHSPASSFIKAMKAVLPESKSVFVIHDQGWCGPLFGDHRLLKKVLHEEVGFPIPESTRNHVKNYVGEEKEIYSLCDKVVCLSESTEGHLLDIYHSDRRKIVRIENGFHSRKSTLRKSSARKKLGIRPEDELLVFVARAVPHKGIIALIRTLKRLIRRHPLLRCAIMGPHDGIVRYLVPEPALAPFVILPGQTGAAGLDVWYAAADVGVITSYTEQCSYAALEMMRARLPIVSSDGNGLRDMFADEKNAYVVKIGDFRKIDGYTKRLAGKIESMLALSEGEKRKMTSRNRNLLKNKYSGGKMAASYVKLFRDLGKAGQ